MSCIITLLQVHNLRASQEVPLLRCYRRDLVFFLFCICNLLFLYSIIFHFSASAQSSPQTIHSSCPPQQLRQLLPVPGHGPKNLSICRFPLLNILNQKNIILWLHRHFSSSPHDHMWDDGDDTTSLNLHPAHVQVKSRMLSSSYNSFTADNFNKF